MTTAKALDEPLVGGGESSGTHFPATDRPKSPHRGALLKVLAGTALTSVLTLGITAYYTGVLASRFDPSQFGAYLLAIRIASMALPFATLAMGTALARYVATARSEEEARGYLLAGSVLGLGPALLVSGLGLATPEIAARTFFGSEAETVTWLGALAVLVGYAGFTLFYAYNRGLERMTVANVGQLLLMGIAPAGVVLIFSRSGNVQQVLIGVGLAAGLGLTAVMAPLAAAAMDPGCRRGFRSRLSELFRYGAGRAPGGAALQAMLVVGPFFATRSAGLTEAGYLLTALTLLRLAEVATSDFGTVMLPRVAAMEAEGDKRRLREGLADLLAFIAFIGPYVSLHAIVWARPLLLVWVGPQYEAAVPIVRVVLLGLAPYVAFMMLRAILDAVESKPVNTINLAVTLAVTAVLSSIATMSGWGTLGLAGATVIGFWLLAALSVRALWRRMQLNGGGLGLAQGLAVNAVLLLPAVEVASMLPGSWTPVQTLLCGAAVEVVLLACCGISAWKLQARWATELVRRMRSSLA